jgi:ribonuclease T2
MNPAALRLIIALLLLSLVGAADGRGRHRGERPIAAEPAAARFDYYLLALSWSPQFCASAAGHRPDKRAQCDRPRGFVVHGLWPQAEPRYPHDCGPLAAVPAAIAAPALQADPPMPPGDPGLLEHEWSKHGTCSGLSMADYFRAIQTAAGRVRIPPRFATAASVPAADPAPIKASFREANPQLRDDMLQIVADRTGELKEVRVCFDKEFRFRRCGPSR